MIINVSSDFDAARFVPLDLHLVDFSPERGRLCQS